MAMCVVVSATAARAEIRDLPVPLSTIYPNVVITEELLKLRKFRTTATSLAGIATDSSQLIGKTSSQRLVAGRPIPLRALREPVTVRRGSRVAVTFVGSGVEISASMIALKDGATGDAIDVRNPETGATVLAIIQADGTLTVATR